MYIGSNGCFSYIDHDHFPDVLGAYGLTEEILAKIYHQVQAGGDHQWQLQGIPTIGFCILILRNGVSLVMPQKLP